MKSALFLWTLRTTCPLFVLHTESPELTTLMQIIPVFVVLISGKERFFMSVSDIIALLENIPAWKKIKELPAKIEALEKRVEQLENQLKRHHLSPSGLNCPSCGSVNYRVLSSKKDKTFGALGAKEQTLRCDDCSFEDTRVIS